MKLSCHNRFLFRHGRFLFRHTHFPFRHTRELRVPPCGCRDGYPEEPGTSSASCALILYFHIYQLLRFRMIPKIQSFYCFSPGYPPSRV